MNFDATIWGPHYWFFLHTIAHSYPEFPNAVSKRKYYDLIQNMPIFIPEPEMGNKFSVLLDKYPVSPYLDKRDSFIRWTHFIHNKYNELLGKDELPLHAGIDKYLDEYRPKPIIFSEVIRIKSYMVHLAIILACLFIIFLYSDHI
jgi:hypothetical protein